MISHILTPDFYAVTSLITLTLGSFYICNQIYERWFIKLNLTLMDTNAIIKCLMVLFGFTIVSWQSLLNFTSPIQMIGIAGGILVGFCCMECEIFLLTFAPAPVTREIPLKKIASNPITHLLSQQKSRVITRQLPSYTSAAWVGACEEILYRGLMTALCVSFMNPMMSSLCVFIVTLFFALSHLSLGSVHVLTKFILGLVCLLSFILTKTILTPIFIHITFNAIAINKYRKLMYA